VATSKATINTISRKLRHEFATAAEPILRPELYQFIFRAISLLTLVYAASEHPKTNMFELSLSQETAPACRPRYQKTSIWENLECGISITPMGTVNIDLKHLLAHFGNLAPSISAAHKQQA
jgi:hypothetical protein